MKLQEGGVPSGSGDAHILPEEKKSTSFSECKEVLDENSLVKHVTEMRLSDDDPGKVMTQKNDHSPDDMNKNVNDLLTDFKCMVIKDENENGTDRVNADRLKIVDKEVDVKECKNRDVLLTVHKPVKQHQRVAQEHDDTDFIPRGPTGGLAVPMASNGPYSFGFSTSGTYQPDDCITQPCKYRKPVEQLKPAMMNGGSVTTHLNYPPPFGQEYPFVNDYSVMQASGFQPYTDNYRFNNLPPSNVFTEQNSGTNDGTVDSFLDDFFKSNQTLREESFQSGDMEPLVNFVDTFPTNETHCILPDFTPPLGFDPLNSDLLFNETGFVNLQTVAPIDSPIDSAAFSPLSNDSGYPEDDVPSTNDDTSLDSVIDGILDITEEMAKDGKQLSPSLVNIADFIRPHLDTEFEAIPPPLPATASPPELQSSSIVVSAGSAGIVQFIPQSAVTCIFIPAPTSPSMISKVGSGGKPPLREIRPKEPTSGVPAKPASGSGTPTSSRATRQLLIPPAIKVPEPPAEDKTKSIRMYRIVAGWEDSQLTGQDPDGDTLLHLAIVKEEFALTDAILGRLERQGLTPKVLNAQNNQHHTPLCTAVFANKPTLVKRLISLGSDVNIQLQRNQPNNMGLKYYRLIHYAALRGLMYSDTLYEILQAANVDLDAFNSEGCSALHCAIESHGRSGPDGGKIDSRRAIYQLVTRGANLELQHGLSGKTPLHYVVEKKNVEFLSWFLELVHYFADKQASPSCSSNAFVHRIVNARLSSGTSALHIASSLQTDQMNRVRIVQLLLQNGAELSAHSDTKLRKDLAKFPELTELLKNNSRSSTLR